DGVALGDGLVAHTEVVLGADGLAFFRVQVVQVLGGNLAGAALVDDLLNQGNGRLGQDGDARIDHVELVGAVLQRQQLDFVLKGDEYVADVALGEGHAGSTAAAVEHG